jgi:hypothetical protein
MSTFALIAGGSIAQLDTVIFPVNPALVWTSDISAVTPAPQVGWAAVETNGVWTFTAPPAAPTPTLAQQATIAAGAGVAIALAGTVTLAATTFPTDQDTQIKLGAVITTVNATGAFPGGLTTYPLKDASGVWHTLTINQYKTVAGAIATYVAALDLIADGNPFGATALPDASVSLTV